MSEFDRTRFSQYSPSQLLEAVQQEQEKANIYEARFRDVVRAYKGLMKEKEALESSLKALSGPSPHGGCPPPAARTGVDSESEVSEGEVSFTESERHKQLEEDGEVFSLRQQVATLAQALSTVTEEKSKMESSFQQDKRSVLAHQESLSQQLSAEKERGEAELKSVRHQLEMVQQSLQMEQRARQEEQEHHADMLKELQGLITSERASKQTLSEKLKETESKMANLEVTISVEKSEEYKQQVKQLSGELADVKAHLHAAEKQSSQPSPLLIQLQDDLRRVKENHELSLSVEQQRANEAERRLQLQAQHEEVRVASLESKLSELSDIVGSYDRQREADMSVIQKLKDRIAQLDSENTALTKAHVKRDEPLGDDVAITALQEKITKLKALLRVATLKVIERSSPPSNIDEMSVSEYSELLSSEPSKKDYQQELFQLRDEFESYKKKAQTVLRSKSNPQVDSGQDTKELQHRLERMHRQVEELQGMLDDQREEASLQTQQLREELRKVHDQHNSRVLQLELQYKQKLTDLQVNVQTTRERTKKLMEEKDSEISSLRGELNVLRKLNRRQSSSSNSEHSLGATTDVATTPINSLRHSSNSEAVQELLDQPLPQIGEVKLLLHAQEQQRVSQELSVLKRKRLELEDLVRDLTEREQKHLEQTEILKSEIRKLERDRSRETESMEYLKNVIYHFMCSDSTGREQLVTPLSTLLHFTQAEIQTVRRRMAARHWLSSPTSY